MASTPTEAIVTGRSSLSATAPMRDTRLDVLRGVALIMIFINHVPGQIFEYVTTKNFGFSDAAEAFVLISGIAVGLAYGSGFRPGNRLKMAVKAAKRAFTLYLAHMITTFMTLALFICGAWLFHRPGLLVEINILAVLMNLKEGIPALLLLGHQIGYNNILPMYGALMLMVPIILLLNARSPLLALGVSGTVWLLAGIYQVAPHNMLIESYWFLNPLSWQFLFTIGIVSMLHIKRGGTIPRHPLLFAAAAGYVALSFVWVTGHLWAFGNSLAALGLPPVITGFDKTFLSLPRLLHDLDGNRQGAEDLKPHRGLVYERLAEQAEGEKPATGGGACLSSPADKLKQPADNISDFHTTSLISIRIRIWADPARLHPHPEWREIAFRSRKRN